MMMVISSRHILIFSILFLLLGPLVGAIHFWPILTYRHVYVRNDLVNGTLLTVHCKSKNNDLGVHKLNYKDEFKFQFKPNIWGTTLFYCGLTWDGKLQSLVAFDNLRDIYFCKDLKWSITNYQPCLFNCDTQQYDRCINYNH
ncbi:putative plant self-incompatibility S1 [Lupinus albus]|uniref:S-protein homolog n=1 Tax=Lupinus albus TaxID=3870 RepID=A0A6A4NWM1_LUPAL|nr:putative plant self-incompatibility S1 [Lupinus albus]